MATFSSVRIPLYRYLFNFSLATPIAVPYMFVSMIFQYPSDPETCHTIRHGTNSFCVLLYRYCILNQAGLLWSDDLTELILYYLLSIIFQTLSLFNFKNIPVRYFTDTGTLLEFVRLKMLQYFQIILLFLT